MKKSLFLVVFFMFCYSSFSYAGGQHPAEDFGDSDDSIEVASISTGLLLEPAAEIFFERPLTGHHRQVSQEVTADILARGIKLSPRSCEILAGFVAHVPEEKKADKLKVYLKLNGTTEESMDDTVGHVLSFWQQVNKKKLGHKKHQSKSEPFTKQIERRRRPIDLKRPESDSMLAKATTSEQSQVDENIKTLGRWELFKNKFKRNR